MAEGCALWLRVSTTGQATENQRPDLERLAAARGLVITKVYETSASAWKDRSDGYERARQQMLADAHMGEFKHLLVWSIDRLTRRGIEDAFMLIRVLDAAGVSVVSVQEPWLSTADPFAREIMLAVAALIAKMESQRRSERVKAGLERRKEAGLPVGGKPGRKDRQPRRKSGYYAAWEDRKAKEKGRVILP
jgi:putative DNA-invertase from lambdoid prophage Rac